MRHRAFPPLGSKAPLFTDLSKWCGYTPVNSALEALLVNRVSGQIRDTSKIDEAVSSRDNMPHPLDTPIEHGGRTSDESCQISDSFSKLANCDHHSENETKIITIPPPFPAVCQEAKRLYLKSLLRGPLALSRFHTRCVKAASSRFACQ
jgi:hypothetical protein